MTESQWLRSHDIEKVLGCLVSNCYPHAEPCNWGDAAERKKSLFVCACLGRIWDVLPQEYQDLCAAMEQYRDRRIPHETLKARFDAAENSSWEHELLFAIGYDDLGLFSYEVVNIVTEGITSSQEKKQRTMQEQQQQAALLRDIFGNPFRPVAKMSYEQSSTIVGLAETIYEDRQMPSRTFDNQRMGILADALEDAGCDNTDILNHCRQSGVHVRGCWVIDLILGRE